MIDWAAVALGCLSRGRACALVLVTRAEGSTPREPGARMLVSEDGPAPRAGTIGGGRLEADAISLAQALLAAQDDEAVGVTQVYRLGPQLGQCCGGTVEVAVQRFGARDLDCLTQLSDLARGGVPHLCVTWLGADTDGQVGPARRAIVTEADAFTDTGPERGARWPRAILEACRQRLRGGPQPPGWLAAPDGVGRVLADPGADPGLPLCLFGAGHVGRALVQVLAPLGWRITWVETRDDTFPEVVPEGVQAVVTDVPEMYVDEAPADAAFLIMTHDHGLDFRLCKRVLGRPDVRYCGVIGSRTKRARFVRRLEARGLGTRQLSRLTCPIGLRGLTGKAPGQVAIAVAAELLTVQQDAARSAGASDCNQDAARSAGASDCNQDAARSAGASEHEQDAARSAGASEHEQDAARSAGASDCNRDAARSAGASDCNRDAARSAGASPVSLSLVHAGRAPGGPESSHAVGKER